MNEEIIAQNRTATTHRYNAVRQQTLNICEPLETEDFVVQPIVDVSPPKWHIGHTTWFFENFILDEYLPGYRHFDKRFNYIFNSYYESQGPRILRSKRGNMTRPGLREVMDFRRYVDEHIGELIEDRISEKGALSAALEHVLETGLQHEQQHQELLVTDLKYILGNNPLFPVYTEKKPPLAAPSSVSDRYVSIPGGIYRIGYEGPAFHWDNETGRHQVFLEPFQLAENLVTNGEFLEFIEAGGYRRFELWLNDGWVWVKREQINAPLYWFRQDDEWMHYTLRGLEKPNLNEPVTHVSFYEADAFARWKGQRLPTEAEWEVACNHLYPAIPESGNFLEKNNFHPLASGVEQDFQMLGDVWEWTVSAYLPYPRFQPFEGALGEYNGKFMINQMVLRGGSCATPVSHIRMSYRNFFYPDKRWQFTGIRLAK